MGARLPRSVAESDLSRLLLAAGLQRISQGKVRDTFSLLPVFPDVLLMVATDRLSIFDFVLSCLVPDKGRVLTAMTVFWLKKVLSGYHHLIAYGSAIDRFLPQALKGNAELQRRALVVKRLQIIPIECVVRGYLAGSGWKSYQEDGTVCGHQLPPGLHDGAKLPEPIFTPATKAESGHDVNITAVSVREEHGGQLERLSLQIYREAANYALGRGIIIADTKFEIGQTAGLWIVKTLADEVLTPDSSRFWPEEDWKKAVAQQRSPAGFDKQPVRDWGKTVATPFDVTGIDKLKPENPDHMAFVHQLQVPQEVISATTQRYLTILGRLTS